MRSAFGADLHRLRHTWSAVELRKLVSYADRAKLTHPIFGAITFRVTVVEAGLRFTGEMMVEPRDERELPQDLQIDRAGRIIPVVTVYERRKIRVVSEGILDGELLLRCPDPDHAFREWLRGQLITMAIHEVDEMIEIDGVRCFDPHRTKGGGPP